MILITGGAGFIGSNFINSWLNAEKSSVINLDCLTHVAQPSNIDESFGGNRYQLIEGNIQDSTLLEELFHKYRFNTVVNFAAESNVDRSISSPKEFIKTNVVGTHALLSVSRKHWERLGSLDQKKFRFLHISTDEVYGTLLPKEPPFREQTPYSPRNPYSASKAASDHLVASYFYTYGLPTIISHCSNNYGPFQFPEKLVPMTILNAINDQPIPIYGDGKQIRDWLYVGDHCDALRRIIKLGASGNTYNIGGETEVTNLNLVQSLCNILDEKLPKSIGKYSDQITFVRDRPGHDRRYAVDITKIKNQLGWTPSVEFLKGLEITVDWYLQNPQWTDRARSIMKKLFS